MKKASAIALAVITASLVALVVYAQPVPGGGLRFVTHNSEMTGSGTIGSPLGLITSCSSTQVLAWNGSAWACAASGGTPLVQTSTVTGTQNDFTINAGVTVLRWSGASNATFNGFTGGSDGRVLVIINAAASADLTIAPEAGASTAANRTLNWGGTTNLVLHPVATNVNSNATLIYDNTTARWRLSTFVSQRIDQGFEWGGVSQFDSTLNTLGVFTAQGNIVSNAGSINTFGQIRGGAIAPAALTGGATVNDWSPSGLADARTIFVNCPSGACTITGLVGGSDGRTITIYNTGAGEIDLPNNSGLSSAANRWNNSNAGGTIQLIANTGCAASWVYSTADNLWHETDFTCYPWQDSGSTLATSRNVSTTGAGTIVSNTYVSANGGALYQSSNCYVTSAGGAPGFGCAYGTNATATTFINPVGYSEGTTQTRSLEVDDGQGTGSTHRFEFVDAANNTITWGKTAATAMSFVNGPTGINFNEGQDFEWTDEFTWGAANNSPTVGKDQGPLGLNYNASGTGAAVGQEVATDQASGRDDRLGEIALKTGTATSGGYATLIGGIAYTTQNSKTLTMEATVKWDVLSNTVNSVASMYASIWGFTDTAATAGVLNTVNGCYFAYDVGNNLTGNKNAGNVHALECWCASASTRTGYLINNTGNSDESFALGVGTIAAETYYGTKIVWSSTRAEFYRRTATGAYTKVCDINTNMPGVGVAATFEQMPLAATGAGDRHFILDQATIRAHLNAVKSP